jgi:hypothetical protein
LHGVRDLAGGFAAEVCEVDVVLSAHLRKHPTSHAQPCMISGTLFG